MREEIFLMNQRRTAERSGEAGRTLHPNPGSGVLRHLPESRS